MTILYIHVHMLYCEFVILCVSSLRIARPYPLPPRPPTHKNALPPNGRLSITLAMALYEGLTTAGDLKFYKAHWLIGPFHLIAAPPPPLPLLKAREIQVGQGVFFMDF